MQKYSTAGSDVALPSMNAKKFVSDVSANSDDKDTPTQSIKPGTTCSAWRGEGVGRR